VIDNKMGAEQFEQLIAPLYRQFAGFLPPNEMALHMSDRYRALGFYPPDALREAVDVALRVTTDARMPTIGWMREQCDGWLRARQGGMITPAVRSEQCPLCVAEVGQWDNGRLAVLHERSCRRFDPTVRSLAVEVSQVA
jgi:hypothetical protein